MTAVPITAPGVYDIPADQYHADPVAGGSLSSSGARAMLPPSCPARYRWELDIICGNCHAQRMAERDHDDS